MKVRREWCFFQYWPTRLCSTYLSKVYKWKLTVWVLPTCSTSLSCKWKWTIVNLSNAFLATLSGTIRDNYDSDSIIGGIMIFHWVQFPICLLSFLQSVWIFCSTKVIPVLFLKLLILYLQLYGVVEYLVFNGVRLKKIMFNGCYIRDNYQIMYQMRIIYDDCLKIWKRLPRWTVTNIFHIKKIQQQYWWLL